jgi:amino acid transporter
MFISQGGIFIFYMSEKPTDSTTVDASLPASATMGRQGKLRKVLSMQDLYFLSLGGIIGSGWLFGSLSAAGAAGPAAVFSWLIGGIFVLIIALTWAELGGMMPASGALARVPQAAHGYFAGFYFGWAYFVSAVTVPPVEAIAIMVYATYYIPGLTKGGVLTPEGYAGSIILMVLLFLANYFGINVFRRFNTGITWWKLLIPSITVILAIGLYFTLNNFTGYQGLAPYGAPPVFSAIGTTGIVFSYLGFRQAIDYSGEARNPAKDVPRATILSVITGIVLYTLLQVAFAGAINWKASGVTPGDWASLASSSSSVYTTAPFAEIFAVGGLTVWAAILLLDAVISPAGTLGIYTGTSARILFALSEGRHLGTKTGEVHERYRIPWVALIASLLIGIVFLFAFPAWAPLSTVVTSTTVFTYLAGATALMSFRKTAPEMRRTFRLPAAGIIAPLGFIMASLIVYWTTYPYTLYAFIAIILGLILFAIARSRGAYPVNDIAKGSWIVVYSAVMVVLSYVGSYGQGYIPFPWDFLVVVIVALIFYAWGTNSGYETEDLKALKAATAGQPQTP